MRQADCMSVKDYSGMFNHCRDFLESEMHELERLYRSKTARTAVPVLQYLPHGSPFLLPHFELRGFNYIQVAALVIPKAASDALVTCHRRPDVEHPDYLANQENAFLAINQ
jgi:hypothetical protein